MCVLMAGPGLTTCAAEVAFFHALLLLRANMVRGN